MNTTPSEFTEALARLDAEIAATEAKLAELRHKRTGAEAFLDYMNAGRQEKAAAVAVPTTSGGIVLVPAVVQTVAEPAATEVVLAAFRPDVVTSLDDVFNEVLRRGYELTREQTRNALHYLVRKGEIEKVGTRRGFWRLRQRDTEGLSLAGERPSAVSELEAEGGERSDAATPPEDHHQDPVRWNGDHRVGASIGT